MKGETFHLSILLNEQQGGLRDLRRRHRRKRIKQPAAVDAERICCKHNLSIGFGIAPALLRKQQPYMAASERLDEWR